MVMNRRSRWALVAVLFAVDPNEPMSFHRTVGLRDEWANIQKRST